MKFYITIKIEYKNYKLKVEQTFADLVKERYKVSGRTQIIILENNRPLFRNKGLKHRRIDWQMIESNFRIFPKTLELITNEINKVIDNLKPPTIA